jgi:lysophospholipase L1-like esterase
LPASYENLGISGQTSQQVLNRWERDVLWHNPKTVVLLIGTNDLALPIPLERTEQNISQMERSARWRGIRVVLCTIPPTRSKPELNARINLLNQWLVEKAHNSGDDLADYHSVLVGPDQLLRPEFAVPDGVHLTPAAYSAINPVIDSKLH